MKIIICVLLYVIIGWALWYFPVYFAARYIIKQGYEDGKQRVLLHNLQQNWSHGNGLTIKDRVLDPSDKGIISFYMTFWPVTLTAILVKTLFNFFMGLLRNFGITDPVGAARAMHTRIETKNSKPNKSNGQLSIHK